MPIRINLLAEEQYLAEMRRRDPVKRAAWLGGFLAVLALSWWGWLIFSKGLANQSLEGHKTSFTRIEKSAKEIADHQKRTGEIERNIHALHRMVTNRVLWSGCLHALQEITRDPIQVTRIQVNQGYTLQPAVLSKERGKSKSASSTEVIRLVVTARDYGAADQNYIKFKERVEEHPWFKQHLVKENAITFKGFTDPTPDKDDPGRVFVTFTMECAFTDQFRN
ncbi:MAG: hypothetical protein HZA92_14430 [Verrucomicrobia bacterium]|nr:hypothetical protein [Verrucomicrobiota bacterium]